MMQWCPFSLFPSLPLEDSSCNVRANRFWNSPLAMASVTVPRLHRKTSRPTSRDRLPHLFVFSFLLRTSSASFFLFCLEKWKWRSRGCWLFDSGVLREEWGATMLVQPKGGNPPPSEVFMATTDHMQESWAMWLTLKSCHTYLSPSMRILCISVIVLIILNVWKHILLTRILSYLWLIEPFLLA